MIIAAKVPSQANAGDNVRGNFAAVDHYTVRRGDLRWHFIRLEPEQSLIPTTVPTRVPTTPPATAARLR